VEMLLRAVLQFVIEPNDDELNPTQRQGEEEEANSQLGRDEEAFMNEVRFNTKYLGGVKNKAGYTRYLILSTLEG